MTIAKRIGATLLILAVLGFLAELLAGPFFVLFIHTWPVEVRAGRHVGAIESAIKGIEVSTTTMTVASGFLGVGSLAMVVAPETAIGVDGKLGAFADLDRGQRVRVAYEVLPDRVVARRIDVLDRIWRFPGPPPAPELDPTVAELPVTETAPSPMAADEPPPAASPLPPERVPELKAVTPAAPASMRGAAVTDGPPGAVSARRSAAGSRAAPAPAAVRDVLPTPFRAALPSTSGPVPVASPASPLPPAPDLPRPARVQEDGTAAVDWLLTPGR